MANNVNAAIRRLGLNAIVVTGNALKWALYNASYTTGQTTYSTTNEITGTGYTAGGQAATGVTNSTGTNKSYATTANPSWTGATLSGVAFAVLYDTTNANKVIFEGDLGGSFSVTAGTFTVTLPSATETTAMIQL